MSSIYLAAKFEMRPVLRGLIPLIEHGGKHRVTSRWITREELHLPQSAVAAEDFSNIDEADLLILDTTFPGGSGREVELGYALARGKRIWMVGPFNNVFHHHTAIVHFSDWKQVILQLGEEQ